MPPANGVNWAAHCEVAGRSHRDGKIRPLRGRKLPIYCTAKMHGYFSGGDAVRERLHSDLAENMFFGAPKVLQAIGLVRSVGPGLQRRAAQKSITQGKS